MATRKVITKGGSRLQAKVAKDQQDMTPYAEKYSCAEHQIVYYVSHGGAKVCPLCAMEDQVAFYRKANSQLENENAILRSANESLSRQAHMETALQEAVEVLDSADALWLKEQLYQFKLDKSVVLKVTHGATGRKSRRRDMGRPNGFIAIKRGGRDPESHQCSSVGGLAIARYYEELSTSGGAAAAMSTTVKALWEFLPGARP